MTTLKSSEGTLYFGTGYPTVISGMLINTLKDELLVEELSQGKLDRVKLLAEQQRIDGVGFLDIMIAHPELNERDLLPRVVSAAHDASGLPIALDCADPEALKNVLNVFPFKPLINSFTGEDKKISTILPLVKESGAAVIGLCLDDGGIPDSVEKRFDIARKLVKSCEDYSIDLENLVIDPLCLTASVFPGDFVVTLDLLRKIKDTYDITTFLGVDNAGFGMPQKELIDLTFLISAISAGLDAALLEPFILSEFGKQLGVMFFAADFLTGNDPDARKYLSYIRSYRLHK